MIKIVTLSFNWLNQRPYVVQILAFYLLSYVMIVFYTPFAFLEETTNSPSVTHTASDIAKVLVLAPLLETFIFQYLVFKILYSFKAFNNRPWLIITISSILFAAAHGYDIQYVIFAFLMGLVLAFAFYFYLPNYAKAFWSVCIIHLLRNFTALIVGYYFP